MGIVFEDDDPVVVLVVQKSSAIGPSDKTIEIDYSAILTLYDRPMIGDKKMMTGCKTASSLF